jgi:quercetin dioxygenase-like cupin family protein
MEIKLIIKERSDVSVTTQPRYTGVENQILISREEASKETVSCSFSIKPGGTSPYHSHDFPHLVKVERGQDVVIDSAGTEHPLNIRNVGLHS